MIIFLWQDDQIRFLKNKLKFTAFFNISSKKKKEMLVATRPNQRAMGNVFFSQMATSPFPFRLGRFFFLFFLGRFAGFCLLTLFLILLARWSSRTRPANAVVLAEKVFFWGFFFFLVFANDRPKRTGTASSRKEKEKEKENEKKNPAPAAPFPHLFSFLEKVSLVLFG